MAAGYLFEIGLGHYNQGNYSYALHEFEKVLLVQPDHKEAIRYIQLIQNMEKGIPQIPPVKEKLRGFPAGITYERPSPKKIIQRRKVVIPKVPPSKESAPTIEVSPTGIAEEESARNRIIQEALDKWEEEIEMLLPEIMPLPIPKRVGDIGLFINEQEVGLKKPILIMENRVLIPFRDAARGLNYSVLDLQEGRFRLLSPEGLSQEAEAYFVGGIPMITQEQLNEYFSVESNYDASRKGVFILTKETPKFKSYLVKFKEKKPGEEKKISPEEAGAEQLPKFITKAAQPYVDLQGSLSYLYRHYNLYPPYRSSSLSVGGRLYDYRLSFNTIRKDFQGKFDHDHTYLNLNRGGLWINLFDQSVSLSPLRNQSQDFAGVRVSNSWDNSNRTAIFAGNTENYISGTGASVKYLGQMLGIEQEFKPREWWRLRGTLLYLQNEAEFAALSGTSSYPRMNLVYLVDNTIELYKGLSFFTQLAQCNYNPDDQPDSSVADWDWRMGSEWRYPKGKMRFDYEFVGEEYVSSGLPASYQDYKGWGFYTDYRITGPWRISGSIRRYHNNVDGDPEEVTTKNQAFSLSSSHRILKDQSVTLSFNQFSAHPSGPGAGLSSQTDLYGIDYFLPFLFDTRLFLNYRYLITDIRNGDDYFIHRPGITLSRSFGRGSSWHIRQDISKTLYEAQADTLGYSSSFGLDYVLNPRLKIDFDSTYTRDKTEDAQTTERLSGSANLRYKLTSMTDLNLAYTVGYYDLKTESTWPRDWSIMLYIRQGFDFSSPANFGKIGGQVILDLNGNGNFDPGEPGVKGVKLILEDGREVTSGKMGYFNFDYVCPGIQEISLSLADLPLNWMSTELKKDIEVKPRRKTEVNFILTKSASIQGRVFIDSNGDQVFQEDEEPLDGISILLLPGEQFRRTNQDGNFKFDNIVPGNYKLKIYSPDLPVGCRVVTPEERELELSPDQVVTDLDFALEWESPIEKF